MQDPLGFDVTARLIQLEHPVPLESLNQVALRGVGLRGDQGRRLAERPAKLR